MSGVKKGAKLLAWMTAMSMVTGVTFSGATLYAATDNYDEDYDYDYDEDWDDWEDADEDEDWEDVETPELSDEKVAMKIGEIYQLDVDGDYDSISWSTNAKGVATVSSDGTVKAKGTGTATITAEVKCTEYNTDDADEADEFDYYAENYSDDEYDDMDDEDWEDADEDEDYDVDDDSWDDSDEDADEDDWSDDEEEGTEVTYRLTCIINVKAPNVKLNATKVTLKKGKTKKLNVAGANKAKIKWNTNKKSVAKVSANGTVTAVKKGKTVITAKVYGKTLKCSVTVKK